MDDFSSGPLSVALRTLPNVHVAYLGCQAQMAFGNFSQAIAEGFETVKRWAGQHGYDPGGALIIGGPQMAGQQLIGYECCIQIPDSVTQGSDDVQIRDLPDGYYAVLTLDKDSATIGEMIGHFFQEYAPRHHLEIDGARPSYEIYSARTLDYCVPVVKH